MVLKLSERDPNLPRTARKTGLKASLTTGKSIRKPLNAISINTGVRTAIKTKKNIKKPIQTSVRKGLSFKAYSDDTEDEELEKEYSHIDFNAPIESTSYVEKEMTLEDFYPELINTRNFETMSLESKTDSDSGSSLDPENLFNFEIKLKEKDLIDKLVLDFEGMC